MQAVTLNLFIHRINDELIEGRQAGQIGGGFVKMAAGK